ncbi:alcohol dehydrogenase, propanol-preferring [Rhodococcus qingshengii]|nr:alcohol dehydrogenase, propanol-preferring [Rhodococcus qingshengii]
MRMTVAGRPMELQDIPIPDAAPGWVVLRVEAAGLCHSDLHILDGSLVHTMSTEEGELLATTAPITLGHEIAGTIFEIGNGVPTHFSVGDRVISGGPMIPRATPGLTIDGGFAQYVTVPHEKLQPIPDGVGFDEAAVATDSIATAYSAVRTTAGVNAGETVAIIGLGGLGLNGVRTAALLDSTVYGVDVNPVTFDAARGAGATECFTEIESLRDLRPDVLVDFAGTGSTTEQALSVVRSGGRVVVVGMSAAAAKVDTHSLILRRQTLRGSFGRTVTDMAEFLDLLAQGHLRPETTVVDLADLNEAYARLERGEVVGRLVTHP